MPKNLSIIITHHKTPELLYLCIKSVKDAVRNIDYEIIITDSEAKKENQELIKEKWPEVEFISFKKNLGYSGLVNEGIKKSKGDYILILNADIIVLDNAVEKMLDYMKSNNEVGIIGPQLIDFAGNIQDSCFKDPDIKSILARRTFLGKLKLGEKIINKFAIRDQQEKKVDWVQGSAMMVKKSAVSNIGLFDERFFMYFEDADWCRRFRRKGYGVIYLPQAKMAHYYHRSSKKWGALLDILFNRYTRTHIISAIKYFWKYRHAKQI